MNVVAIIRFIKNLPLCCYKGICGDGDVCLVVAASRKAAGGAVVFASLTPPTLLVEPLTGTGTNSGPRGKERVRERWRSYTLPTSFILQDSHKGEPV